MAGLEPLFCEKCREKWNRDLPGAIEVRFIYIFQFHDTLVLCPHRFREEAKLRRLTR